ncbi:MAG: restriction endonuclease [Spirochaetaceae bacterium]|nr:MAG: restriction endonuclease [Spirochaetaceae bacterium]
MGIIILIIIVGVGVGLITFFIVKSVIAPKKTAHLVELVKQKKTAQAIRVAKQMIAKDARNPEAHYLLGLAYDADSKPELALMEFKTVNQIGQFTKICPEVPFRTKIAELFEKFNQPEEALKEYLVLLKRDPQNAEYYFRVGRLFEERSKSAKATAYFKKAIDLDGRHASAHLHLGLLLYKAKRPTEARPYLDFAVRAQPDNPETHYYIGRIQKDAKEYTAALGSFEKASRSPEFKLKSLIERGMCLLGLNDTARAIVELERAVSLSKDKNELSNETLYARYLLAACFEKNREIERAIEMWEEVYRAKPGFRDVAEKLSRYQEMRTDDRVKDYMTSSREELQKLCISIVEALGLSVREVAAYGDGCDVIAVESQSRWRNTRKLPKLFRFLRDAEMVDESRVRAIHEDIKKKNITRAVIVTSSTFTRVAIEFAESRPVDLWNKEKLQELLQEAKIPR